MPFRDTDLDEVKIYMPPRFEDERGFFSETFNAQVFSNAGLPTDFVQDNHSLSRAAGVVRGLHFQIPPVAQAKLVRVARGSVLDVAVDIRIGSPTFGRHVAVKLTAAAGEQLFVPRGFAHGFATLEPDTEVLYKVNARYSREQERGLLWNDPELGIDWGVAETDAVINDRDRRFPRLADLGHYFNLD
ncbi:MAG: dTDP-4-dehydrorhamnose 3,5-epimerase [Planctomycetota bacterium]